MCNTGVKHTLVESEYNERRGRCEEAAQRFAQALDHPVRSLRDVTRKEWSEQQARMDPVTARRALHVIGENERVIEGRRLLARNRLDEFGALMFESHESSMRNFENSCPELDFIVETARSTPGVLGARLSGGGFGGSAVALLHPRDAEGAGKALSAGYQRQFGRPCDVRLVTPSDGATVL
jgi:galactokinase